MITAIATTDSAMTDMTPHLVLVARVVAAGICHEPGIFAFLFSPLSPHEDRKICQDHSKGHRTRCCTRLVYKRNGLLDGYLTTGLLVVIPIPIPDVVVIRQETLLLIQQLQETIRKEHAHVPSQIL